MVPQIVPSDSYVRFLVPPRTQSAPDPIKKLLPNYVITDVLGSGGFATVYKATDPDGRKVAVKVPKMDDLLKTLDMAIIEKFKFESDIWKKLQHEHIVEFYDSNTIPLPYISMELMEGGDLAGLMKNHRLTVGEAIRIMQHILEGISYAHRMASVHRDLKPENILFTSDGVAKITDWGIGKYMASEGITKTIETKGTVAYSAPEQFDSRKYGKVDWQTDIFQLGIVFYEMLTGVKPFEGRDMAEVMGKVLTYEPESPGSLNPDVPREIDGIIMGALEKDKKKRWDSGAVMLHELRVFVSGREPVKRVDRKEVGEKRQSEGVLRELEKQFVLLGKMGADISGLEREMKPIEKYARLMWYDKVVKQGNILLKELKERYKKELERLGAQRKALMKKVRALFEECLDRELDIERLYDTNKRAMGAYEKGNYDKAAQLFLDLNNDLERLIDEDDKREAARKEFDHLKKNTYCVLPPPELLASIESDIDSAEGILVKWANAIENARKVEEKCRREEDERKRREEEARRRVEAERRRKEEERRRQEEEERRRVEAERRQRVEDEKERKKAERRRKKEERKRNEEWLRQREIHQRQEIWSTSPQIVNVNTDIYVKKFLHKKKITVSNNLGQKRNFIGMQFLSIPCKSYYMGKYSVTQKEWKAIMGTTPWKGKSYVKEGDNYPATYISWDDCQEFVTKLNDKEGVNKYRLPTENEWKHACKTGTTTKYCFGDNKKLLGEYAWYDVNAFNNGERYAHRVGQKKPNKWGFYDMHGNVWEWCQDWYDDEYKYRVLRGGSWESTTDYCKSAVRFGLSPDFRNDVLGFRLVRSSD